MPRTYKKKKIRKYTAEDVEKAINEVKNEKVSIYAAAIKYNIPTTTLFDKVKENHCLNIGRPLAIPLEQEQKLANGLRIMEKWGFGLSRQETLELVKDYVEKNNLETPFKNNKPGTDWFINFKKRHQLSVKKPQPVEYVRKKMTDPFVIYEYFEVLENTLVELNLFDRPDLIWNMDETSLCLDPTRTKVVGAVNKPCSRTTFGSAKENITVLAAASASGQKLSPLIIYKGKNVWNQWMAPTENYDFELAYAASSKGWMEGPIFLNYLERVLFPALGEERPVLIIFDGHSTHVSLDVIYLAIRHGITILKLPPHTSHLLQPLDVAVFKSFKCKWDAKLVAWQRHNVGTKMPKNVFAQTFADTWQETSPEVIQSGFRKTGIHPFNGNIITEDMFDKNALKRYKNQQSKKTSQNPKSLKMICVDALNVFLQEKNHILDLKVPSDLYQSDLISASVFDSNDNCDAPNLEHETPTAPQQPNLTTVSVDTKHNRSSVSRFESYDKEEQSVSYQPAISGLDVETTRALTRNQQMTDTGINNVTLLTKIFRKDIQNRKFVANKTPDLPKCLLQPREKYEPNLSNLKVNIISNEKVNFEDLLLEKITQEKNNNSNLTKKKRVAKGAEVITTAKVLEEREKQIRENATKKPKQRKITKGKKSNSKNSTNSTDVPYMSGININKEQDETAIKIKVLKEKQIKKEVTKKSEHGKANKRKKTNLKDDTKSIDTPSTSGIKKNKRKKFDLSNSLTDISDTLMSIYSDSDTGEYNETLNDEYLLDIFGTEMPNLDLLNEYECKENSDLQEISQNMSDTTTLNFKDMNDLTKSKNKGIGKKTKEKENNQGFDKKETNKTCDDTGPILNEGILIESNKVGNKSQRNVDKTEVKSNTVEKRKLEKELQEVNDENCDAVKENREYRINDSVLVRYLSRKKWTYYIGFIKDVIEKDGETHYCVDFLKTIKKPQLKFIEPKKIDHDELTELLIVKNINVKRNLSNVKEYYLLNDCDNVYF